jgi:hypothetical protein
MKKINMRRMAKMDRNNKIKSNFLQEAIKNKLRKEKKSNLNAFQMVTKIDEAFCDLSKKMTNSKQISNFSQKKNKNKL